MLGKMRIRVKIVKVVKVKKEKKSLQTKKLCRGSLFMPVIGYEYLTFQY